MFAFYSMFPYFFIFLQTSLIIKELTKHKNKYNRKVFHDRENSENRFSEFSYFMKCFKKYSGVSEGVRGERTHPLPNIKCPFFGC